MKKTAAVTVVGLVLAWMPSGALAVETAETPPVPQEIANGVLTDRHPSVGFLYTDNGFCTATLIGCRTVLTAAHCLCGDKLMDAAACEARQEDVLRPSRFQLFFPHAGFKTPVRVAVHPQYRFGEDGHDLAVLTLPSALQGVAPSKIADSGRPPVGTRGEIVGFGLADDAIGLKRTGQVTLAACNLAKSPGLDPSTHLCWSFASPPGPPGEDSNTCGGDSGGPLFVDLGTGPVLAGVTSGGASVDCAVEDSSFDADVFLDREWIRSVAGEPLPGRSCGVLEPAGAPGAPAYSLSRRLTAAAGTLDLTVAVPPNTEMLRFAMNGEMSLVSSNAFRMDVTGPSPQRCFPFTRLGILDACEVSKPAPGIWHLQASLIRGAGTVQLTATVHATPVTPDCHSPIAPLADVGKAAAGARVQASFPADLFLYGYTGVGEFGFSVSGAGDVDGNGFSDVIGGAPRHTGGQEGEGAAFLIPVGPAGVSVFNRVVLEGNQEGAQFGYSVAGAGDVNGDGYTDILVGAPYYDSGQCDEGAAFLFLGGPSFAGGSPATAAQRIESDQEGALLGWSVAAAGDIDADGYDDVVVGAPRYDDATIRDQGLVLVFRGGPEGLRPEPAARIVADSRQPQALLGTSVAGAGDVNGDGYDDIVAGAPWYRDLKDYNPKDKDPYGFGWGGAFVFFGGPSGIPSGDLSVASLRIQEKSQAMRNLGESVAGVGDVDGDGYDDFAVGAPLEYNTTEPFRGFVLVYPGRPGVGNGTVLSPEEAGDILSQGHTGVEFGNQLAAAGDTDGDGFGDLLIGMPRSNTVAAYLLPGSPSGITQGGQDWASLTLATGSLGRGVAAAGDVNHDGFDDSLVGFPYLPGGQILVHFGGRRNLPVLRFQSMDSRIRENEGTAKVAVLLTTPDGQATTAPASVHYTLAPASHAQAGKDYVDSPGVLTFPAGTASGTVGSIEVEILNDFHRESSEQVVVTLSAPEGASFANTLAHTLNIDDDEGLAVRTFPTLPRRTGEDGGTATLSLVLASQPADLVTVEIHSTDLTEGSVPEAVTFSPIDWNFPQTVTVTGVDDPLDDGDVQFTVRFVVVTNDLGYRWITVPSLTYVNADDDVSGVRVEPTSGLATTEPGGKATFTVSLAARPTADVAITLASSDTTEGTVPDRILFTPGTWDVPQTVTVAGADDRVDDGDLPYAVRLGIASSDQLYAPLDPPDVAVVNEDDDSAGLAVAPARRLATSESGDADAFTLSLTSEPEAAVTVSARSTNLLEGRVEPAEAVFTAATWNIPYTFRITGVDDLVTDGDSAFAIALGLTTSDSDYAELTAPRVDAVNRDDERVALSFTPEKDLVTTEQGGTAKVQAALSGRPRSPVTVHLESTDATEGTAPPTLEFQPSEWNVPQTVTLKGVDDAQVDGDVPYAVRTWITSGDPLWAGYDPPDLALVNRDNDVVVWGGSFYTISPCRMFDSRMENGAKPLLSSETRTLAPRERCGIPATARAIVLNVTIVSPTRPGFLTIFPGDHSRPNTSAISFAAGKNRANNAVAPLSSDGSGNLSIWAFVEGGGSVHVILDVAGYFD